MSLDDRIQRRAEAAVAFDEHEQRGDGARVTASLADGLAALADTVCTRVHDDVELAFGLDSMLAPLSALKSMTRTKDEIEIYQVVESAIDAQSCGYVGTRDDWYLRWLARLRLGEALAAPELTKRMEDYLAKTPDERRLAFSLVLERTIREARRAPLVLYRLLPLAVSIVTEVAFGDHLRAQETRKRQVLLLPAICDCRECRGNVLDNAERCPHCGNPLWNYQWLTATE